MTDRLQAEVLNRYGTEVAGQTIAVAAACVRNYVALIEPIRGLARKLGYAIGVHGTLVRDVDLIAVPMEDWTVEPQTLVDGIAELVRAFNEGVVVVSGPVKKPHGRLAWAISGLHGFYIDLSVCPRLIDDLDVIRIPRGEA